MSERWVSAVAEIESIIAQAGFEAAAPHLRMLVHHEPPPGADLEYFADFYERWAAAGSDSAVEVRLLTIARHAAWQHAARAADGITGRARMQRVERLDQRLHELRANAPSTEPSTRT